MDADRLGQLVGGGVRRPVSRMLMTADPIGGVWTYALGLARALAPLGVQVTLASMGAPLRDEQRRAAAAIPGLLLHESDLRLEWMNDAWDDVDRAGEWLLALAREAQPDVVHLNGYAHAALPWPAPVIVVAHSCVCSWWRAVHGEDAPPSWNEYRRRVTAGLRAADAVVAPTQAMLDALTACYDFDSAGRIEVIANGIDVILSEAKDLAPGAHTPKELLTLGVGRLWDEAKNLTALATAAPGLPCPVFIAGDATPPDGAQGLQFAPEDVTLLGRLSPDDVQRWMRRASIYALPARYEPFGLSVLEAARAGCALVLGDIPSLREVWDDAATFVAPDDVGALTRAITALASNEEHRAAMAGRARHRAARYGATPMAERYFALYSAIDGRVANHLTTVEEIACVS